MFHVNVTFREIMYIYMEYKLRSVYEDRYPENYYG